MMNRQAQAERRVRDAIALKMKVRLLADTRAELAALERAIWAARAYGRVSAALASVIEEADQTPDEETQADIEQALRDCMSS